MEFINVHGWNGNGCLLMETEVCVAAALHRPARKPPQRGALGGGGAHRALCPRCVKRRLFSTAGSHGSQFPEFHTPQPLCWCTRDLLF